jgi:hypothetical protein
MKKINNEEIKYKIELEVIEVGKQISSKRIIRSAERNIKKMLLNRIKGQTGEC